jgi:hypothetical protein
MSDNETKPMEANKISLEDLRNILIIVGIFLFFTGWIYIYYFYDYFGISMSLVSVDYTSYIVYSFEVLIAYHYLFLFGILILIYIFFKWLKKYIAVSVIIALSLFLVLYWFAKRVANDNAVQIRSSPSSLRHISFVFKEGADFLAYKFSNDSLPGNNLIIKNDLIILKDPGIPSQLYLLGQNQEYFFVLFQPSLEEGIKALPLGSIYFIKKDDVLYSKITITSNKQE